MDFTICSKVLKTASEDYKYAFDLLMQFVSENPHRVAKNESILNDYLTIAENSEIIRTWISGMDFKNYWKNVEIKSGGNIYINTCNCTYDKNLVVNEKEDYLPESYGGLNIFNKDEAIEQIKQPINKISIKRSIVATNGSQIKKIRK